MIDDLALGTQAVEKSFQVHPSRPAELAHSPCFQTPKCTIAEPHPASTLLRGGIIKRLRWAAIIVFIFICIPIPSPAETQEQGPGTAELSNLSAARKALAEAEKALQETEDKTPTATEAEIAKAKLDIGIAKLKLGVAEERARTVLVTIGASLPVKDSPVSQDKCYMARPLFGDLASLGLENWSVGTTIATSVVRYDFSSKKAALATGAGAGIAIRYYGKSLLGTREEAKRLGYTDETITTIRKRLPSYISDPKGEIFLPLSSIKPECRATTSDVGKERSQKLASSLFSITPIVYYSKQTTESDLSIQPAIMLGVLDDIISIGTGFNLTGQEKGKMFLLLSLGYGFKF